MIKYFHGRDNFLSKGLKNPDKVVSSVIGITPSHPSAPLSAQ